MPKSLDELRAELARGLGACKPKDLREAAPADDDTPELTDGDLSKVDMNKMRRSRQTGNRTGGSGKFTISTDGNDALIQFGKHAGENVSDLAEDPDGRSYLQWIVRSGDFDKDLIEVVEYQLELES